MTQLWAIGADLHRAFQAFHQSRLPSLYCPLSSNNDSPVHLHLLIYSAMSWSLAKWFFDGFLYTVTNCNAEKEQDQGEISRPQLPTNTPHTPETANIYSIPHLLIEYPCAFSIDQIVCRPRNVTVARGCWSAAAVSYTRISKSRLFT